MQLRSLDTACQRTTVNNAGSDTHSSPDVNSCRPITAHGMIHQARLGFNGRQFKLLWYSGCVPLKSKASVTESSLERCH